ncbi:MAG: hypothetical protein K2N74_05170, partial [Clostridiales bacterium]|nr:hypothetical protein [Clostridiales bacterium]
VTTVKLSDGTEYSISWTIEKAKFDLSAVRWIDDGNISFNEKGMTVALIPDTIPKGLTPVYGGVRTATKVGDSGTASVSFTVSDTDNYCKPEAGKPDTYIFKADSEGPSDFEWTKDWEVVPSEIPVNWAIGTISLSSGKKINGEILAGGFNEYVEYDYFETDASGKVLDSGAAALEEPAITENKIRYYIAVAKIKGKYAGQYVFAPDVNDSDLISPVFEAGYALTAVQVVAKKTEYSYWGSPVTFQYKVTQGAIADTAFDVVYYRGMIRLLSAPTDPGAYRAQVTLKNAYTDRYYIEGVNAFDFTIVRATITINWNESVKPPVLNLTQNESKYVSYEYRDDAGNTVGISNLRTPGTYGVIARIKDTSKYIFDNDTDLTEWKEFTVASGDAITDPSSSLP